MPWVGRHAERNIGQMWRGDLQIPDTPFVAVWADGSFLEVEGKRFDSTKCVKKSQSQWVRGQICAAAFMGPWMLSVDFARGRECEETVGRRILDEVLEGPLRRQRLTKNALVLLDSLYGDAPPLKQLEGYREKPSYIVGVGGP